VQVWLNHLVISYKSQHVANNAHLYKKTSINSLGYKNTAN